MSTNNGGYDDPKPIYEEYVGQLTQLVENLRGVGTQIEQDIERMEGEVIPEAKEAVKEAQKESNDIEDIKQRAEQIQRDVNVIVEAEEGNQSGDSEKKSLADIQRNIQQLKSDVRRLKGEVIEEEELVEDDLEKFGRMASDFVNSYRKLEKFKQTEKWNQLRVMSRSMTEYAEMQNRDDLKQILNRTPSEKSAEEWIEHIEEMEGKLESVIEKALQVFERDIEINEQEESSLENEVGFIQRIISELRELSKHVDRRKAGKVVTMINTLEDIEELLIGETQEEEKIVEEEETAVSRLESRLEKLGY